MTLLLATDHDDDHLLVSMAGPHLEVFKFGLYVFFPIAIMIHYGDPDWYAKHVLPYKDAFVRADLPQVKPPGTTSELKEGLEAMKRKRNEERREQLKEEVQMASAASAASASPRGEERLV